MHALRLATPRNAIGGAFVGALLALAPATAHAAAPSCNDMNVGVPHNAATPIFIDCTGGTGTGAPDVLVGSGPTKGTVSPAAGGASTDQWGTYTPNSGGAGGDSFTLQGVSSGGGSGGSGQGRAPRDRGHPLRG